MTDDRYAEYYATKLWRIVPAIYRALDGDPTMPGPLQEMVNRIGAQAAVLRRSIDRMWEDQSIESCDDWIIPYIGDLLATRLVACLDARAKRLDVAKTIYYRRRKGTVGLLEELTSDIAARDARVVEFFRHMGRTRHNFDPPIGLVPVPSIKSKLSIAPPIAPPPLEVAEGLSGMYTHTPMGGFADLRHHYGATKTNTAFDEYFHTADFRLGRQSCGWHSIPKLGVFVWWLQTFGVPPTTPVAYKSCSNQYTFDPTGREIPLFAATRRSGKAFGENWTAPEEWQLPVLVDQLLLDLRAGDLYPNGLSVLEGSTPPYVLMALGADVTVNADHGRFRLHRAPSDGEVHVQYHYGFMSDIGAGTYDQRYGGGEPAEPPAPVQTIAGGGTSLATAVAALPATGSVVISDSLTYGLPGILDCGGAGVTSVAVLGKNKERPVIRAVAATRPEWIIVGAPDSTLALEGIHLVGADVVLKGEFSTVTIRCATLDPGTSGEKRKPPTLYDLAADHQKLWPTRLFVEARIKTLVVERAITGPIRTRNGGAIERLSVSDSIIQAIPESAGGVFTPGDLYDADALIRRLQNAPDPLAKFLHGELSAPVRHLIKNYAPPPQASFVKKLTGDLNTLIAQPIYSPALFEHIHLSDATLADAGKPLTGAALVAFNRRLLEEAMPVELAGLAIGSRAGETSLSRTTVLGPIAVHRLDASECILDDVAIAEDAQDGCIRFSAYADGSVLHRPYESVKIAPKAALFYTREFGQADYARLLDTADDAIVSGGERASILEGAQNGSEMGAFAREVIALKRRGLAQKLAEYMPIGTVPVWIDAT